MLELLRPITSSSSRATPAQGEQCHQRGFGRAEPARQHGCGAGEHRHQEKRQRLESREVDAQRASRYTKDHDLTRHTPMTDRKACCA